jgi:hypothetical protein
MADEQTTGGAVAVEEQATATKTKSKKAASTGNLIMDVAKEVEGLTKVKALHEAENLVDSIETEYFRLGGVLNKINENSWFEGFPSFDDMVSEKFGFQPRKARYLILIYVSLVKNSIPWEKVGHLGWTKLKDLAPHLTLENLDEWVAKAETMSVIELQALLKAKMNPESADGKDQKTKDGLIKMKFNFHPDQADPVNQALAKARGELHTEFDTVALAGIAASYIGGPLGNLAALPSFDDIVHQMGAEPALQRISELYPSLNILIQTPEDAAATAAAMAAEAAATPA